MLGGMAGEFDSSCPFCRIASGGDTAEIVFRDAATTAFLDWNPINPGHILVVPNFHVADFEQLSSMQLTQLMPVVHSMAKAVKAIYSPKKVGLAVAGFSFLVTIAVYGLAWLALSMLLPRATSDPGASLPGAVLVGLTIAGMQSGSQLYLPNRLGRASELYGAIGVTVVTLGWFFILGRAMILAMALDAVIHERFGTISQAFFSLPVLRILPRKSPWIRRFFDLDTDE